MQGTYQNNIKSLSKLFIHKNNKKMRKDIDLEVFFLVSQIEIVKSFAYFVLS